LVQSFLAQKKCRSTELKLSAAPGRVGVGEIDHTRELLSNNVDRLAFANQLSSHVRFYNSALPK
jgi:hypothetical protein